MNNIVLMGRLVRDPDVRYTQSGKCVCQVTLAVNRMTKDAEGHYEADFIPVIIWNKPAELVGNSCHKGQRLLVGGRLQIRSYDAKDGTKRWVTEVIASTVEFIEPKDGNAPAAAPTANGSRQAPAAAAGSGDFGSFGAQVPFDEEVPF